MAKPIKKKKHTVLSGEDAYAPIELSQDALEAKHTEHVAKRIKSSQTAHERRSIRITKEVFSNAAETLMRLAPDEMTMFESSVLCHNKQTGKWWREWLGRARRVSKEGPEARAEFEFQAGQIVTALSEEGILVSEVEYEDIPFCREHK